MKPSILTTYRFVRKSIILSFFSLILNSLLTAQTNIDGVINSVYARIDQVFSSVPTDIDSVLVNSVSGFNVGDTVLIHMTVGASYFKEGGNMGLLSPGSTNTGKYGIFLLKEINAAEKLLILNSTLPYLYPLQAGEYGQIVKIPTYKRAIIKETLTCKPYIPYDALDPLSGTGGILVLLVKQGLVFNADINVDGKGFPGAQPDALSYPGTCSTVDPAIYSQRYFNDSDLFHSALKGYGIASISDDTTRGRGYIINGGGGGNGRFSGGGGGGNGGMGGKGGYESQSCGGSDIGGLGGILPSPFFYSNNGTNRISLGGGGGTSSQILPDRKATAGGAGAGIVIIVCDSLIGNKNIYARGQSVSDSATAGAGGGGAGGTIILHVNKYTDPPKLWVSGGNGGKISISAPEACGPGGGGGSGVIWCNNQTLSDLHFNINNGMAGNYQGYMNGALHGTLKPPLNNLIIPIKGFLLNNIPDGDTICYGFSPHTINAAPPVGGTGLYTITWLESTDAVNWNVAEGTSDKEVYTPVDSINTKYFRRYVKSSDNLISDSSNIVIRYVLPSINNPLIYPADTAIKADLASLTLYSPENMTGGNGTYSFIWEESPDSTFSSFKNVGYTSNYVTPTLTDTIWYRRIVISGPTKTGCRATSNLVKISVIPLPPFLNISHKNLNIQAPGNSSAYFSIETNTDCIISSDASWLTISNTNVNGIATINLSAEANTAVLVRTAILTISGAGIESQTILVTQDAASTINVSGINADEIQIYPVPANEKLIVQGIKGETIAEIYDVCGRLILASKLSKSKVELNLTSLPKGLYLIKLQTSEKIILKQFIKR